MRKVVLALTAATSLVAAGTLLNTPASAGPFARPDGIRLAASGVDLAESVQFFWEGRRYCWYDDGWQGPGFYWCGYRWRRGLGWGGGYGWHGWHHGRDFEHREGREFDRGRKGREVERSQRFEHREGREVERGQRVDGRETHMGTSRTGTTQMGTTHMNGGASHRNSPGATTPGGGSHVNTGNRGEPGGNRGGGGGGSGPERH
jgi:hypothetical protein